MKTYRIFSENIWEYTLTVSLTPETKLGTYYKLYYSKSEIWSHPGEIVLSAYDDGNAIHFNKSFNTKMDYSEFANLLLMLSAIRNIDSNLMEKYTMIDEENLTNI